MHGDPPSRDGASSQDAAHPRAVGSVSGRQARLLRLAFGKRTPGPGGDDPARTDIGATELDLSDPQQRWFGDFELVELLGRGGTGSVYRARQRSLDREVALKLLAAGPWASGEYMGHFRREARSAALLQHPNIVSVYELGERDGLLYYAMQLIPGRSLAERIAMQGPAPPRQAAELLRTLALAVDHAHRRGMLHLDLKPGNVLLDGDGIPHIADFGLARPLDADGWIDNEIVAGTPCYMAPEQARLGRDLIGAATDVWGLGAIGYELLTGLPPFPDRSPQETLRLLETANVRRLRRYRPTIPKDLEAIVLRCLKHLPGRRYASARALAEDIECFLLGRPVSARPLGRASRVLRWMRREPQLAITLWLLLALAALAIAEALLR